ncbi:DUF4382 domain-containing protein [Halobacteria archaeon AArc-curdl1]|uniref:DUF4382 domain-containing protein n=1 Tax=Natronosalvus hydrolyticus TaxID=2979988 RepID=A0AAP3E688_9EURY|nr:DUF4382 domain-containing protein [Halobacteria archaeon AArc-curdl1]
MHPSDRSDTQARDQPDKLKRRTFIGTSSGVGAALLAGCTGASDPSGGNTDSESPDSETTTDDDSSDESGSVGNFRLLISDLPADIGDFDSLEVSFDRARIFRADKDDDRESTDDTGSASATEADDAGGPIDGDQGDDAEGDDTDDEDGNDSDADDPESDGNDDDDTTDGADGDDRNGRGFFELDLDGATVDLTQVVGGKAMEVFDGELEAGRYTKIELYAAEIEGIVDGELADVKIPSEKLRIVKPFEVTEDEAVTFVFDINVVRKGNGGYNLLPVIAKSGIVGEDVEVEEIEPGDEDEDDDDTVDEDDTPNDATERDDERPDAPGESESDDTDDSDETDNVDE